MTSARIEAAARADYNLSHGLEADDETRWNELGVQPRAAAIARATALVAAIDAADDRVRLTMPEFNAIKADAVHDLNSALHRSWDAESRTAAQAAGVPDFIHDYATRLGDHYVEPVNHEAAMSSLVRERLAAALRTTADHFDHASLEDITGAMDLNASVPPRFKRLMIRGCADWLRSRADELDEEKRTPYYRVNTRAVIDLDRHTALLGALGRTISRSKKMAATDRITTPFIMTDVLVGAIESTGAVLPAEE
ncbi:hypothetical protein [Paenarthrobacter sp. C1]|uniref:hypothetical protein n=1 Tax=Paenarthrobacter sp. C1 TaxID=3400220 RepID=UPI003BF4D9A1